MSKDATGNRLEECNEVFVDVFNNLILEGHRILKEEDPVSSSNRMYTRKADGRLRSGMRDIRKESRKNGMFRLICGIENQAKIDNTMPERVMGYEYADYPMNLVQVAHLTKEERERLTSDFRIVAEYLACKKDGEKWHDFLNSTKEIRHVEELLNLLWELSGDERYEILCNKLRSEKVKEKWTMCELAEVLESRGIEMGIEKGIMAMIHDNLDMGIEKKQIVEKLMRYFSFTFDVASDYYERASAE